MKDLRGNRWTSCPLRPTALPDSKTRPCERTGSPSPAMRRCKYGDDPESRPHRGLRQVKPEQICGPSLELLIFLARSYQRLEVQPGTGSVLSSGRPTSRPPGT